MIIFSSGNSEHLVNLFKIYKPAHAEELSLFPHSKMRIAPNVPQTHTQSKLTQQMGKFATRISQFRKVHTTIKYNEICKTDYGSR